MKKKKEIYFEDLDMTTQEILIDLIVNLIEKKRNRKKEEDEDIYDEEVYNDEESRYLCQVE